MMNDDYSKHLGIATRGMMSAWPLLDEALRLLASQGTYNIADYGVADGGTSIATWLRIRDALRARGMTRCNFFLSDLPGSNIAGLAEHTSKLKADDTHVYMSWHSFYEKVNPPSSIDLCFSANSFHYLAKSPVQLPDSIHANTADGEPRRAFQTASDGAWGLILERRAAELREGGFLVAQMVNVDSLGRYMGNNNSDTNVWNNFSTCWKQVLNEGLISADQYGSAQISHYLRTRQQLEDVGPTPFELIKAADSFTPCPFRETYNGDGDGESFALAFVDMLRSWSEVVFRRTGASQEAVRRLYELYKSNVVENPGVHSMDLPHLTLVFRRAHNKV